MCIRDSIYAVPTTAGTGSELTVAAVISDPERQAKLVIVDPRMVPKMAALDPSLMTGLPPHITAATGIDALTHAIEAFVGNWCTPYSDGMALSAVGLIFENLRTAYRDGSNLEAREKMALASTYAGFAFTRANVGYVHAIAHQFGGKYHTPHGLANAITVSYTHLDVYKRQVQHGGYSSQRAKANQALLQTTWKRVLGNSRTLLGIGRLAAMLLLESVHLTKNAIALPFVSSAKTPLTGQVTAGRQFATVKVSMDRVNKLRVNTRSTVNHIALTCLDGALRSYLQDQGVELGRPITCLLYTSRCV